ncbi:MAG: acyl-CoA thioesterase domain-containing protein [Acidobacteriota bacterium]
MGNFNDSLSLTRSADGQSIVLDPRPEHRIGPGAIHFAVLTTVAEVAAANSVGAAVVPASVTVQLMRRAQPDVRLEGRGKLLRRGRRLAVAEGEVWQQDRLVAKATVNFAILG